MNNFNFKNTRRLSKKRQPLILNNINIPKQGNLLSYISIGIAFFSLIISIIVMFRTAFPEAKLHLENATLNFDSRAIMDSTYMDSLYVKLDFNNNGNKTTSLTNINIVLSDSKDSTLFAIYKRILIPVEIAPGKLETCVLQVFPISIKAGRHNLEDPVPVYKIPYKWNYFYWRLLNTKFRTQQILMGRLLSRTLDLKVKYNNTGGILKTDTKVIEMLGGLDLNSYIGK